MAQIIERGSEKYKLHLSLLAAEKSAAAAEAEKKLAVEKSAEVKPKLPERKTE